MATPDDIDAALDILRGSWKMNLNDTTRSIWDEKLADVPAALLAEVAVAIVAEEEYPPRLATVLRRALARMPRTAAGETGPGACPDCRGFPGWREMARHFVRDGAVDVEIRVAACECRLGRSRSAVLSWRALHEQWSALADTVAVLRTHRDLPWLGEAERYTPERRQGFAIARALRSSGEFRPVPALREVLGGRDGQGAARDRTRQAEWLREHEERDEGDPDAWRDSP